MTQNVRCSQKTFIGIKRHHIDGKALRLKYDKAVMATKEQLKLLRTKQTVWVVAPLMEIFSKHFSWFRNVINFQACKSRSTRQLRNSKTICSDPTLNNHSSKIGIFIRVIFSWMSYQKVKFIHMVLGLGTWPRKSWGSSTILLNLHAIATKILGLKRSNHDQRFSCWTPSEPSSGWKMKQRNSSPF